MTSTEIAYYYYADRNPDARFHGFVPNADITEEQFGKLEPWQQDAVKASPFFMKTKPRRPKPEPEVAPDTESPTLDTPPAPEEG